MLKNQQKISRIGRRPVSPRARCAAAWRVKFLVLLALLAFPLLATEHRGVVKFGGLPVPGATVTASQGDKKLTAVTDEQGLYDFPNLTDGLWTIEVDMLCFEPIKREIAVTADSPAAEWDLKLQPFDQIKTLAPAPAASQTKTPAAAVDGAATAPAAAATTPAANTVAATTGKGKGKAKKGAAAPTAAQTGFQRAQVNAAPGASAAPTSAPAEAAISSDDANKGTSDGMLINGSVNNGAASPFAQNPAFGNARRGLRSLYNGNIGVQLDSSFLDAESYSLTGQPTPKPPYTQLTGLVSFGGPIRIPHKVFKYQPFFTVNYQYQHSHTANITPGLVPTEQERGGDLSALSNAIYDPQTGNPFPGNTIPLNRISPQALSLLNYYPQPNFTGSIYNYQAAVVQVNASNAMQVRVNKTLTPRWQINGQFAFRQLDQNTPNLFDFLDRTRSLGQQATLNLSRRIGTRMFLNLGGQFSRQSIVLTPFFANQTNVSELAGITGNNQEPINYGPPSLGFSQGLTQLNDSNYSAKHNQTDALTGNLNWSHSPHNFQFGADLRRQDFTNISQANPRGGFTFTGADTTGYQPCPQDPSTTCAIPKTGSDLGDFLLGTPDAASAAYGNADKYFHGWYNDVYANDDWRVSPGFTVNFGVHYDYNSPLTEQYNRLVNLDFAPFYSAYAPVVGANPVGSLSGTHYPNSLINPDRGTLSPRLGIAWRPFPASSFVVRAGYGIYYNTSNYLAIANAMAQQAPLSHSLQVVNTAANPLTLATAFSAQPNISLDNYAVDPDFRIGYAQTWNLSLQRDLPGALQMTVTYLGTKGTRAQQAFYPWTYPVGSTDPCAAVPRPAGCPTSGFLVETSNGNSTREAGSVQMRRRLRSGFTATATYTFSKAIDDAGLGGGAAGLVAQNWLDLAAERALSTFDQRHLLNLTMQYSTGVGVAGGTLLGGWRGVIVKDWTVTTNLTVGSGLPLTPTCATCIALGTASTGPVRPEYTGQPLYAAQPGMFLNPQAYTSPIPGQWGNAGRDSITGPGQFALNASMARTFRLNDRFNFDLRVDATNVLNHVVYTGYYTAYGLSQFGFPSAVNNMRHMQATLRLRF